MEVIEAIVGLVEGFLGLIEAVGLAGEALGRLGKRKATPAPEPSDAPRPVADDAPQT